MPKILTDQNTEFGKIPGCDFLYCFNNQIDIDT